MSSSKVTTVDEIPGCASHVWGGYVWMTDGGVEHRWSKRATREECEAVVLEACQRLGVEAALSAD